MKKHSLLFMLLCLFVFGSCQKDEITVTIRESGTVSVKVVGAKIKIMNDSQK